MDLISAVEEAKVVIQRLEDERRDQDVWSDLYQEAVDIATEFEIPPSVPRINARQQHRDNHPIDDPKAYWRVVLYYVFLDHLVREIRDRILQNEDRYAAQYLLPKNLAELDNDQINNIFATYAPDLTCTVEEFHAEIGRWKARWELAAAQQRPDSVLSTLNSRGTATAYPNIYKVFFVLLTMPATSASCERSFSGMKRIKSYLRSTMSGERLSSLGVIHIHRDQDINVWH